MTKPDHVRRVQGSIPIVSSLLLAPILELDDERTAFNDDASNVYSAKEVAKILSSPRRLQRLACIFMIGVTECGLRKFVIDPCKIKLSMAFKVILA